MNDVMLDLETMGAGPDAAIVSIGAVAFDVERCCLGPGFYQTVTLQSSVDLGGVMDPATIVWWMEQDPAARAALQKSATHISRALQGFTGFVDSIRDGSGPSPLDVRIWGNGAAFDNVILRSSYRRSGSLPPWSFWNDRCYRTVKAMNPGVRLVRIGTHHNAFMDAVSQAAHLLEILKGRRPDVSAFETPSDENVTPEG